MPGIEIEQLRAIADREWDALTASNRLAAGTDLYDRFLATAASMLWNGASDVEVGDYLVEVEIECLGIDTGDGIRERAELLARAIREHLAAVPEATG